MNVPKIWRRASRDVQGPSGPMHLAAWGWSAEDPAEAERRAAERLARMAERVAQGLELPSRYDYGERPLREEILDEVGAGDGAAVITRNAYGARILNTARVMFVDVDLAQATPAATSWLGRWFGKNEPSPGDPLGDLRTKLAAASGSSFRLYGTAAGFRLLATERLFEPGGGDSEAIMRAVGADPAFVALCRAQRSFRARLTPKPWRCGVPRPPAAYPRESAAAEARQAAWLAEYEAAARGYATCRLVEEVGPGRVHEAVRPILALHDDATRAGSSLPLA